MRVVENEPGNRAGFRFPKGSRLRNSREFRAVVSAHGPKKTRHFVVYQAPNAELGPRLGISVSSRVGRAAERNRVKRRLREFFRHNRGHLMASSDTVIIAKPGAQDLSHRDIEKELSFLLKAREA